MDKLRVVIAMPTSEELAARMRAADERIDVIYEPDLLPPERFISDHSGDPAWSRTPEQQARFEELLNTADVIYGVPDGSGRMLKRAVDANPALRWVQLPMAGGGSVVRHAGFSDEQLKRVTFTTAAGIHAGMLAEFSVWALLSGAKELPVLLRDQHNRYWQEDRRVMRCLGEMRIVVVGLGAIGRECVRQLRGFGTTVVGVNRSLKDVDGLEAMYTSDQIVEAFKGADGFINALPAAVGTDQLISREAMAALNPGAIVASVGRGNCIDEPAMIEFLKSGQLAFAGLDVTEVEPLPADSPLWEMPNVVISPHTAANSAQEDARIMDVFEENLQLLLADQPMRNVVDTVNFY